MKTLYVVIAVLLVILGGAELWGRQADQQVEFYLPDENQRILIAEEAKPRFVGEIGGIYIVPDERLVEELIPQSYTTYERLCGDARSTVATFEEAGELDFDIELPDEYELQLDDMNTGAVACNGVVYAARRSYTYRLPDGWDADIGIGRSLFSYDTWSFADDRPQLVTIEGRDVILVEALTKDGSVGNSLAWIPEPFGKTYVRASGLSRERFLELVRIVVAATKQ